MAGGDVEQPSNLSAALVKFQSAVPVIPKNRTAKIKTKTGSDYSYSYADLADIWSVIRKPLADNGLAVTQQLASEDNKDYIVTKIWHTSGETDSERFRIPTEGKAPQEAGSVITYYKRYALGSALGISTEEDDDGAAGNTPPQQAKTTTSKQEQNEDVLARAKKKINETLEEAGHKTPVQKKAFIMKVLHHSSIDSLIEADLVMDQLEAEGA